MKYSQDVKERRKQLIQELIALETPPKKYHVSEPYEFYIKYLHRYRNRKSESFFVGYLNGAHDVIAVKELTRGLINRCIIHPRAVFSFAIEKKCCAVILSHNHPSSNLQESAEDRSCIDRLKQAGELLGIRVLDHIWFGPSGYRSAQEEGIL